jgi:hypothetical protein
LLAKETCKRFHAAVIDCSIGGKFLSTHENFPDTFPATSSFPKPWLNPPAERIRRVIAPKADALSEPNVSQIICLPTRFWFPPLVTGSNKRIDGVARVAAHGGAINQSDLVVSLTSPCYTRTIMR